MAAACFAILALTLIFLNSRLGSRAEPVNRTLAEIGNQDVMAVVSAPLTNTLPPLGLSDVLAGPIAEKLVSVQEHDAGAVIIITVPSLAVFPVSFVITITMLAVLPPCGVPASAVIRRTLPASRIPDIAGTTGSPVTLYPDKFRLRRRRWNLITYRRWWCAESDPN